MKSVSSAYSTSSGRLTSAGGRVGRRDSRSRSAPSRGTVKSTGLRMSPCGVPIVVVNAWQSPDDRRGSSDVSAKRRRFIRSSDSPMKIKSKSINLSRRMVSKARHKSMSGNSTYSR